MLRGMAFVDYMNMNSALKNLYGNWPKLKYTELFKGIVESVDSVRHMKTFICAPKPDNFLLESSYQKNYYDWLQGLQESWYFDIIEGRLISHRTDADIPKDIANNKTFYIEEKGTDVNLASNLLIKAFNNSYDVAFVFSADSDYIHVYQTLKTMGKLIVLVTVEGQGTYNTKPETDHQIVLTKNTIKQYLNDKPSPKIHGSAQKIV